MRPLATLVTAFGLFFLAACEDAADPVDPEPAPTTGSFDVEAPESVFEGQPFRLIVVAVAADGTKPDGGFDGTVTLSASSGSVTPSTVFVIDGVGSADVTVDGIAGDITLRASAGGASGTRTLTVVGSEAVARIEVTPGAFLLVTQGETRQLEARAYDVMGRPTRADFTWSSTNSGAISITSAGLVTATSGLGSAQIIAEADGVRSPPVLGLIARPAGGVANALGAASGASGASGTLASGAVLVDDDQVVGSIEPVDDAAPYEPGWLYRVRLTGVSPTVGQILLGTGESPIGGRVVGTQPSGSEIVVTLELVPLEEMFDELVIDESFALDDAELVFPDELASTSLRHLPDGTLEYVDAGAERLVPSLRGRLGADENSFPVGPFTCKTEATAAPLRLVGAVSFRLKPTLKYDLFRDVSSDALTKFVLHGGLRAELAATPVFNASFEGKLDCKLEIAEIRLPIGGPVALIFGGTAPVGVGMELAGSTTIANFGLKLSATAEATVMVGVDCTDGSCDEVVNGVPDVPVPSFEPVELDPGSQFRVNVRLFGYGYASLEIGNPFLRSLRFTAFEARGGIAHIFDLAPAVVQVEDPSYGSNIRTVLVFRATAGAGISGVLRLLKINLVSIGYFFESPPIARSPAGTFSIDPASVRARTSEDPGDEATFLIVLDPSTYFQFDAIGAVEIFWKQGGDVSGITLEPGVPPCDVLTPETSGQVTFECEVEFDEAAVGLQTFYAFVKPKLFGFPLPFLLEVASDGKAEVTVTGGGPRVTIAPGQATLQPGATKQFTAAVTGLANTGVTWHTGTGVPHGTIDAAGLYTAPEMAPGESAIDSVFARSIADAALEDTAIVLVSEPPCTPTTENECGGSGSSWGDPHLLTPDGRAYDFMAVGDFVLAKSTAAGDGFEIQTRFRPPDGADEWSWNEAVAMRVGEDIVNVYATVSALPELVINGEDMAVEDGFSMQLASGAVSVNGDTVTVSWADQTTVRVAPAWWAPQKVLAFVETFLPSRRSGAVEGLLGDFDGDPTDDLRIRDGAVLADPSAEELYLDFRQSWRVAAGSSESLFFRDFENWDPFFPPGVVDLGDLDPEAVANADAVCRAAGIVDIRVLHACTFDVALTGDEEWALVAAGIDPGVPSVTVVPGIAYVAEGGSLEFNAIVSGVENRSVTWSATGGSIALGSETAMTYTAPDQNGVYTISATLVADGSVSDAVTVHVTDLGAPPGFTAVWSGAVSTDWHDGANWVAGTPPIETDNVFIPASAPRHPFLAAKCCGGTGEQTTVNDLLIEASASLTLSGRTTQANPYRLLIAGDLAVEGTLAGQVPGEGHVILIGTAKTVRGTISSNLEIQGSISLGGSTVVTDTLRPASQNYGAPQPWFLDLGGNALTVRGNARVSSFELRMDEPADLLVVGGDIRFSGVDLRGKLTAGELRLAGDFEAVQASNSNEPASFAATGTKVVLNGTAEQTVLFRNRSLNGANASHFDDLEITNPTVVQFLPPTPQFNSEGAPIRGDLRVSAHATVTGATVTIDGDLFTVAGSNFTPALLRLAGPLGTTGVEGAFAPNTVRFIGAGAGSSQALKPGLAYQHAEIMGATHLIGATAIAGNLTIGNDNGRRGPLDLNGQTLVVGGDFLTIAGADDGWLMTDPADRLLVRGNMDLRGGSGTLSAGEIQLEGDFDAVGTAFMPPGTRLVLSGAAAQDLAIVSGSFTGRIDSFLQDLEITNSAGATINDHTEVRGDLDLAGRGIVPAGATVTVVGTLFLRSTAVLQNDGTLTVGACSKEDGHTIDGTDPC